MNVVDATVTSAEAMDIVFRLARRFGPLVGQASTDLLMARSVALHRQAFPWLPDIAPSAAMPVPLYAALEQAFAGQPPEEVIAATDAIVGSFSEFMTKLIGARLTTQFIRSALDLDAGGG